MLLTTAAIAISRKVKEEKRKKQEARQGLLSVGDSDVARRAFNAQTQKTLPSSGVERTGTEIKFEDPNSLDVASPAESSPDLGKTGLNSPQAEWHATSASPTPIPDVASPVKSEKASLAIASPVTEQSDGSNMPTSVPPPYSAGALSPSSSAVSPSVYSRDSDSNTLAPSDTRSVLTSSTGSQGTHALRVRTKGADLSSGFPYHPALYDMQVPPTMWNSFTAQIVQTTKFGIGDHAQMWAAATATAMTGAFVTSVFVGRGMNRQLQEKKVKDGLRDTSDGSLGETLEQWNETYFKERGLFVHLELSESTMKRPDQKSKIFRREAHWYGSRDERDRKREERKFVIVITKLDEEGKPTEAAQELGVEGPGLMAELPNSEDPKVNLVEAPGDFEQPAPVELPGDFILPGGVSLGFGNEKLEPPIGYAELDSGTTQMLEKTNIEGVEKPESGKIAEENVTANSMQ